MTPSFILRPAPSFLAAFASPFSRSSSIAFSTSPLVVSNAFLQSSGPAPVASRNALTCCAVIAIRVIPLPLQIASRHAVSPASTHRAVLHPWILRRKPTSYRHRRLHPLRQLPPYASA